MVQYTYDAWGNHTVAGNSTLRDINPFRYRGYYYDTETKLYYLQTRYYDPETGRFINMDSIAYANPNSINGLNLYAYCGNNPVMNVDPTGTHSRGRGSSRNKFSDWCSTITGLFNPISKDAALIAVVVAMFQGRWDDLKHDWDTGCFNPFNQNEEVALKSKVFSFYNGESVIRHSIFGTGQILGNIFLQSKYTYDEEGIQTLNHEYGHSIQEKKLGLLYLPTIALPSVITYYAKPGSYNYFSMPWERTADYFGGVNRDFGYKENSLSWAFAENILGPIVIPFYFLFGY